MKKIRKAELERHADKMLLAGLEMLEDLHLVHSKSPIEKILNADVPGTDITVGKLIRNAFKIVEPLIEVARRKYPAFFKFVDWAHKIVKQLLSA